MIIASSNGVIFHEIIVNTIGSITIGSISLDGGMMFGIE